MQDNAEYVAPFTSPPTESLLPRELAETLGILADSTDRYSLMAAIQRCDDLVNAIRAVQLVHSQNLCRVANRLAFAEHNDGTEAS